MQELKRQIIRKLDKIEDEVLLNSVLEMLNDQDGDEEEEEVADSGNWRDRKDNRTLPPPMDKRHKSDADSWLDTLGR